MDKKIKKAIKNLTEDILNLLFPKVCYSCYESLPNQKEAVYICPNCLQQIELIEKQDDSIFSLYKFNPTLRKLIHQIKYKDKKRLAKQLCFLQKENIKKMLTPLNIKSIIPVPLYSTRFRERGYNQSVQIGESISTILNIPLFPSACKRTRYTRSQAKLSKSERESNLVNAFRAKSIKSLQDGNILLIDDVLTTGSTLKQVSLAVQKITTGNIYAFTLASAKEK